METNVLTDGLIWYCCLIPVIALHEFAHAWSAWKLGDNTAKLQGRVTVNPIAHMDMVGTVILPLMMVLLAAMNSSLAGFIIGWGKPVPVNPYNLKNMKRDDTLISMAGPLMNILIALVAVGVAKVAHLTELAAIQQACLQVAWLSLFLCFFNLIPIPPLDGSHPFRYLVGMREETYLRFSQFGFIILIILIQFPLVQRTLGALTKGTYIGMTALVGGFT